jgi:hypothetical protein
MAVNVKDLPKLKCSICNKEYHNDNLFDKHKLICSITHDQHNEDKLGVKNLSKIVCYLVKANMKLEEEVNELKKWANTKKKKFAVIEWLNENYEPKMNLEVWIDTIIVTREHLNHLFKNNYNDGVVNILKEYLPLNEENFIPLKSFDQKDNTIFVYKGSKWDVYAHGDFEKLISGISKKLLNEFKVWQDENEDKLYTDEFSALYLQNVKKIMGGNYSVEQQNNAIHRSLYKYLKMNLKNIIQYEFAY